MIHALTEHERRQALSSLPAWTYDETRQALYRHIETETFSATFALMTRIALEAERTNHHPEWSNVYNRLDVWLTTHDAGGVSTRDVAMATAIDALM
jgi:4a-hydroxytetrahydrobiopterin dehydratase